MARNKKTVGHLNNVTANSGWAVLFLVTRGWYWLLLALSVTACNGPLFLLHRGLPVSEQVDARALSYGMQRGVIEGRPFQHVTYTRSAAKKANGGNAAADSTGPLHVYIEGDGIAWRSRFVISDDPTSRNVLMLDLMAMDSARTLYLGRPCYLGLVEDPHCNPDIWTYRRFSADVVDSMVSAIQTNAQGGDIVLFGHSGGAALALLIAARLPAVQAVVTVAGNLNTSAWVRHHHYTPLYGSLNPASQPALPASIRQLHLLGVRDTVIPPALVEGWIDEQPSANVWRFETHSHSCCWNREWPAVLNWVRSGVSPVYSEAL